MYVVLACIFLSHLYKLNETVTMGDLNTRHRRSNNHHSKTTQQTDIYMRNLAVFRLLQNGLHTDKQHCTTHLILIKFDFDTKGFSLQLKKNKRESFKFEWTMIKSCFVCVQVGYAEGSWWFLDVFILDLLPVKFEPRIK